MTKQNRAQNKGKVEGNSGRMGWIAGLVIALAIGTILVYKRPASSRANPSLIAAAAKSSGANHSPIAETTSGAMGNVLFEPTVPNVSLAPVKPPKGMVWIPGGEFSMGAQNPPDMDEVGMNATADSRPMDMASTIWLAMSGNGRAIGIGPITIDRYKPKAWCAILRARTLRMIRRNQDPPRRSSAVARSYAPINIAPGTLSGLAEKVMWIRERTTSAFAA